MLIPGRRLPLAAALLAAALGPAALVPAADCNENGVDDFTEVESGENDCDGNGVPDSCDVTSVNQGLAFHTKLQARQQGGSAASVVAADLDRDGHGDIAVIVLASRVSILWGEGGGGFSVPDGFELGRDRRALAAGDLNGDGRMDLAAGGPEGVTVLFQLRNRLFASRPGTLPLASTAGALALADLDGDGDLDIVFTGRFEFFTLLGTGNGDFAEPEDFPAGSGPFRIAAADIDADGDTDVATANFLANPPATSVSVFLNRGSAAFAAPRNYAVGAAPTSISAGDLDGNGRADLVVTNAQSANASVFLAREGGTLSALPPLATGGVPFAAGLADIDRDGDTDIAISRGWDAGDSLAGGAVTLFWNLASGVLRRGFELRVEGMPVSLAALDLFGGEEVEVALVDGGTGDIDILVETRIANHPDCDLNLVPDGCDVVDEDCNGNGLNDICDVRADRSRDCNRNRIPDECEPDCNRNTLPDDCDARSGSDCNGNLIPDECDLRQGSLGFEVATMGAALLSMVAADLDRDGWPDLAGLDFQDRLVVAWNGEGGSLEPPAAVAPAAAGSPFAVEDLDGDGDLDIAAGGGESRAIRILLQSGPRAFSPGLEIALEDPPGSIAAADLDADGIADVAAVDTSGDVLTFAVAGAVRPLGSIAAVAAPGFLAARDIDADGASDLACILAGGAPAVLWNRGSASFDGPVALRAEISIPAPAIADLDHDGDLEITAVEADALLVLLQIGPRFFERVNLFRSPGLAALAVADVDIDGQVDLIAAHRAAGLEVRRGDGEGAFGDLHPLSTPAGLDGIAVSDIDRSGSVDIVAAFQDAPCPQCPPVGRVFVWWNRTVLPSSMDIDRNGRPDECDRGAFRRGDADGDGALSLTDAVFTLRALFQGGPAPGCAEAADADNDGSVSLTDPISVLEFLFRGGAPPAAPGPPPGPCGLDTDAAGSPAALGCETYTSC